MSFEQSFEISKTKKKGCGCGKVIPLINAVCGSWSLKHNEYYYCKDCNRGVKMVMIIRDDGTLQVVQKNGQTIFTGTPEELAQMEGGLAIEEVISMLDHLRSVLIIAQLLQKRIFDVHKGDVISTKELRNILFKGGMNKNGKNKEKY